MMSKLRSLASQLCGIFPYGCLLFVTGSIIGFQMILIAELHKPDSEISTNLEQLSWFASLDIIKLAGTLFSGLLAQRLGSRFVAFAGAILNVTTMILYYCSTTVTTVIVSRVFHSLLTVSSVTLPYISEISEPRYRSSFLAMAQLSTSLGMFFSMLLGSLLYWRHVALANIVLPTLAAVTVLATPNSPTWLASQGRLEDAESALQWTRGWVEPQQIQTEYRALVDSVYNSTPKLTSWQTRLRHFTRQFVQRSFVLPFVTINLMLLTYCLGGVAMTEAYAIVIFRELNSPIDASVATAIMGAMGIAGNVILFLIVRRVGKRKLIFTSIVVIGSCETIVAIVGYFELRGTYSWAPPIALIVAFFANSWGAGAVMSMLFAEIFPPNVRYIGTSMSLALKVLVMSFVNKVFLYVVEAVTLPGVYLGFAVVNAVALFVYYFLLLETEGRSLGEIENHFRGVKNIGGTEQ